MYACICSEGREERQKKETGPREASRGPLLSLVLTRQQLRHLLLVATTAAEKTAAAGNTNSSKRNMCRESTC
jgi:hypothetical protein